MSGEDIKRIAVFHETRGELKGLITALDEMTDNAECVNNPDLPAIRSVILTLEDAIIEGMGKLEEAFDIPACGDGDAGRMAPAALDRIDPMKEQSIVF